MQGSCCGSRPEKVKNKYRDKIILYRPLIVIVAVSACAAAAISLQGIPFMHGLMGMFLLLLAMLKLFDLPAFAVSFARYDVVAARSRAYALLYPFIELGLGALYLSGLFPAFTYIATMAVMAVGSIGVVRVIQQQAEIKCACVGTGFNLPVGYVTIAENTAMFAMAALALIGIYV